MYNSSPIYLLLVLGLVQVARGGFVSTAIYPSCTGTGFPNFSYAKGVQVTHGTAIFPCNNLNTNSPSPPVTITWFYYVTYPPEACGNPDLPDADQCCHTTSTSTLTFYSTAFVNTLLGVVGTSTGNVTAGAFLGQSVTYVLTLPSVASLNLNCNTAYGQEARTGLASVIIANGPVCVNGGQIEESCPGSKS